MATSENISVNPAAQSLIPIEAEPVERPSYIQQWYDALALDVGAGQIAQDTANTYKSAMKQFQSWAKDKHAIGEDLGPYAIKQWVAFLRKEGRAVKTLSVWLTGVRHFFQWMVENRLLPSDPTMGVRAGSRINGERQRHKRDALSMEEVTRLLSLRSLTKRDKAMIYVMLYTGARAVELHRARIEDIRTERGEMVLYVLGKGQNEKEPLVIAGKPARDVLMDYLAEQAAAGHKSGALFATKRKFNGKYIALSRRSIRQVIKEAMARAGIIGDRIKTVHSLRHTAATTALENGADVRDVQKMLRHTSVAVTEIYLHEKSRIEKAAEKLIRYDIESESQKGEVK